MGAGPLQRGAGRIDGSHHATALPAGLFGGPHACQRCYAEPPGVAKAVEHLAQVQPLNAVGKTLSAVALVQVKAGLVAFGNVQRQAPVVFVDGQLQWRLGLPWRGAAPQPAGGGFQAFELAHVSVRALIQLAQPRFFQQGIGQHRLPALGACAGDLGHQRVAIAVHDQARQPVRFTVHQPHAVTLHIKSCSSAYGTCASRYEK